MLEQELTDSYFTKGRLVIDTPELLPKRDSLRKSIEVVKGENFRAQKKADIYKYRQHHPESSQQIGIDPADAIQRDD